MNSQGATGKPWIPILTLENYLNLENVDVISSLSLRKIIMMHGFKSKVSKEDLLDAVRSIELMNAQHSTLHCDNISSNAFLSLSDVIKDLTLLRWQECCITSLETINSVTDFGSGDESSPKRSKLNCNTSSSTKEDSEGHKTQSQVLKKKIKGNTSSGHYGQQVDQDGQQVDQVKRYYGQQVDQVKRPKVQIGEQVDRVNRPQRDSKKPVWMKEYAEQSRLE